jgi:non-heme chloroperoxidase
MLYSNIIKDANLKIYEGAPHGMCTMKNEGNADLLDFAMA